MNHIYRVMYNHHTHTYQAVPEISTGKHKTASEKSSCAVSDVSEKGAFFSLKPMALCAMAMGLSSTGAWAAPTGGHISAGDASISQHGKITNIQQNSQRAAINWQTFGIKADETVNFQQPNAQAVILNRVIGNEKSVIDGAMNANGKVFISNPNGMIFGKNAQINVGALLATTAKIKDQDFMNGFFKFDEATGDITHLGDIKVPTGGVVALIAPIVENKGKITAPQGKVLLASAEQFSITLPDSGQFAYTLDRGTLQGLVDNGGAILADGGHVILTAKGTDAVKKSLIKHTGKIEANTVQNKNGVIELLGDLDNTRLEASGSLKAEAEQGDGGFVETSAAKLSINDLKVSTKSKFGKTGLWVIDPKDLIVAPSGGDTTGQQVSASLQNTDIQLKSKDGAKEGKGDVIINDEISWDKNTLTLNAENNIYINENLNGSGNARLELKYGQATPDGIQADGSESDYYFYRYLNENKVINLPAGASLTTQRGSSPDNLRRFQVVHADRLDGRLLPPNVAIGEDINLSGKILTQGLNGVKLLHGLGHKINGLTIEHAQNIESNNNSPQHIGFINELKEGGIRDLTLNNVNIKTKINDNCGGNCDTPVGVSALVGYAQDATIKNVDVSGEITHTGDYRNIVKQNDWVGLEGERVYYKPEQPTNTITVSSQPVTTPTKPVDTNNPSSTGGSTTSTTGTNTPSTSTGKTDTKPSNTGTNTPSTSTGKTDTKPSNTGTNTPSTSTGKTDTKPSKTGTNTPSTSTGTTDTKPSNTGTNTPSTSTGTTDTKPSNTGTNTPSTSTGKTDTKPSNTGTSTPSTSTGKTDTKPSNTGTSTPSTSTGTTDTKPSNTGTNTSSTSTGKTDTQSNNTGANTSSNGTQKPLIPTNTWGSLLPINPHCAFMSHPSCNNKVWENLQNLKPISQPQITQPALVSSTPTETGKDKQPVNNTQAKPFKDDINKDVNNNKVEIKTNINLSTEYYKSNNNNKEPREQDKFIRMANLLFRANNQIGYNADFEQADYVGPKYSQLCVNGCTHTGVDFQGFRGRGNGEKLPNEIGWKGMPIYPLTTGKAYRPLNPGGTAGVSNGAVTVETVLGGEKVQITYVHLDVNEKIPDFPNSIELTDLNEPIGYQDNKLLLGVKPYQGVHLHVEMTVANDNNNTDKMKITDKRTGKTTSEPIKDKYGNTVRVAKLLNFVPDTQFHETKKTMDIRNPFDYIDEIEEKYFTIKN